jgi:hypothetical protein
MLAAGDSGRGFASAVWVSLRSEGDGGAGPVDGPVDCGVSAGRGSGAAGSGSRVAGCCGWGAGTGSGGTGGGTGAFATDSGGAGVTAGGGAALATCAGGSGTGRGAGLGAGGSGTSARFGREGGRAFAGSGGLAGLPSGAFSSGLSGAMSTKSVSPRFAEDAGANLLTQTIELRSRRWRRIEHTTATGKARRDGSAGSGSFTNCDYAMFSPRAPTGSSLRPRG